MGIASLKREGSETRTLFFWIFLVALMVSVFLHLFFLKRAEHWVVAGFSAESYDAIVPRTFRMKRVEIDPKTLEEPKQEEKKVFHPAAVTLVQEHPKPTVEVNTRTPKNILSQPEELSPEEKPGASSQAKTMANLLPGVDLGSHDKAETAALEVAKSADPITLPEPKENTGNREETSVKDASGGFSSREGGNYSSLDELLAGQGAVSTATAPILMPTDLLFEYDSDTLRPAAAQSLAKLGTLITKNAQAVFRIEGYTDSFGSDEYNQGLSLRRAEAVKTWLQNNMGIDPARITTAGLGKSRLLVPATGTVEQQQLNRRVEIVITTR